MSELSAAITRLYQEQQAEWPEFASAVAGLEQISIKSIHLGADEVVAQFNPARMRSTGAKTDPKSIAERPCFLCTENRPTAQRRVPVRSLPYSFLANPFPVVSHHFTVVEDSHVIQEIEGKVGDFLALVEELGPGWCIFFNGAKAGASAPDHRHFQTIPAQSLPLCRAIDANVLHGRECSEIVPFAAVHFILCQSTNAGFVVEAVERIVGRLSSRELLNLAAWQTEGVYRLVVMPRTKHRPDCYHEGPSTQFLVSPATIELGGLWVLPRQQDFDIVNSSILGEILRQVCFPAPELSLLLDNW